MAEVVSTAPPKWLDRATYPFAPKCLDANGARMSYLDEGSGDPIVFVHGSPAWSFIWRGLVRDLSRDYRCLAPDMIGFGLSSKPESFSHTPEAHCRALNTFIDSLGLKNVTLVLHGFGGPIGMAYAQAHTENVKRMVLMNTWFWDLHGDVAVERSLGALDGFLGGFLCQKTNAIAKVALHAFGDPKRKTEAFERALCGPLSTSEGRTGALAVLRQTLSAGSYYKEIWNDREALIDVPKLMIWGAKDPLFGAAMLNHAISAYPQDDVERMDDVGHFPMEEKPAECARAIRTFFAAPVKARVGLVSSQFNLF
ncbi:alpha/beta fold hydrolase [bacterium]|nr:MAG: alpha/beta fold hydrolase [bacterium]